jgi:hypothetical protein
MDDSSSFHFARPYFSLPRRPVQADEKSRLGFNASAKLRGDVESDPRRERVVDIFAEPGTDRRGRQRCCDAQLLLCDAPK